MLRSIEFLLVYLLFFCGTLYAQNSGTVNYLHILSPKHGFSYTEMKATLLFESGIGNYNYNHPDSHVFIPKKDSIDNEGNAYTMPARSVSADPIGWIIYSDQENREFVCRDRFGTQFYIYDDTIPHINWEIQNEKRKVGKIDCQKAIGKFRGRIYDAWFAPSIPISFGPWKLQGLPGLILEAHSQDGEVSFVFESLEIPSDKKIGLEVPEAGKKIGNFQEYVRIREEQHQNSIKKLQADLDELTKNLPPGAKIEHRKSFTDYIELTVD